MHLADFDFHLPDELIAQHPLPKRDGSRLLLIDRERERRSDHLIQDLPSLIPPGSLLIVNDTKVFPARIWAHRSTGGKVEVLLLEKIDSPPELLADSDGDEIWIGLVRSSKKPRIGEWLSVDRRLDPLKPAPKIQVLSAPEDGRCQIRLQQPDRLEEFGSVPLPPYIQREDTNEDHRRYQTVYAKHRGSIAAPTAGLHFTPELLENLDKAGIERCSITLHVGLGTFMPVRSETIEEHRMEMERFSVPESTADAIRRAKASGRKIIAVGTTVVRTLESSAAAAGSGQTRLFITPGFRFRIVDAMLTNFHLPKSTLLMLVSAFAGRDSILSAYEHAIAMKYRFYSYGDAMLIL